jgi:polysaccharide deacetylase 2 family uncharacterized protein YibQ
MKSFLPGSRASRHLVFRFLLVLLAALLASCAGCRKKQLSPSEVRAITRELVFAARAATSGQAEIGMRPELQPQPRADHIYITVRPGRSGQADPATLAALESQLDQVASRHGLERVSLGGAPGLVRFDYRRNAQRTHAIHIITSLLRRRGEISPRGGRGTAARLAILVDDLGYERATAESLFALPYPLTLAVLPHLPYSPDIAEEAYRRGYQVMLHLPMESTADEKREAIELRRGMSPAELTQLLAGMLETVPHAIGVNNHQGSLATADPQLMAALMPALRERELFFIDSRTTTATVAYDAARHAGVPAASRNVFLDDTPTREAVRQQLELAARHARQQGFTIAIGHPHPATLQALAEYLPQLEGHGVALVFASELVH